MRIARVGWEIEYSATIHELAIGYETPIGQVVAPANLVGLFLDIRPLSILDEMEDTLGAEMMGKVKIKISCAAVDAVRQIIGVGSRKADPNLKIGFTSGDRGGLCTQYGCCAD